MGVPQRLRAPSVIAPSVQQPTTPLDDLITKLQSDGFKLNYSSLYEGLARGLGHSERLRLCRHLQPDERPMIKVYLKILELRMPLPSVLSHIYPERFHSFVTVFEVLGPNGRKPRYLIKPLDPDFFVNSDALDAAAMAKIEEMVYRALRFGQMQRQAREVCDAV